MQIGVLGTARGQAADATKGMSAAANMGASRVLTQAKAKQTVRSAKFAAAAQIGTSLVMQGAKNMRTSAGAQNPDKTPIMTKGADGKEGPQKINKGGFFSPVDGNGNKVSGFSGRLAASSFFD